MATTIADQSGVRSRGTGHDGVSRPRAALMERRVPQAYGYVRVSSDRQAESGLGLAAQRARIEEYSHRVLPGVALVEIVADEAVSASQVPFLRP